MTSFPNWGMTQKILNFFPLNVVPLDIFLMDHGVTAVFQANMGVVEFGKTTKSKFTWRSVLFWLKPLRDVI